MEIPDHLICLLRNMLHIKKQQLEPVHGTMDWFKIGKGVRQGCINVTLLI